MPDLFAAWLVVVAPHDRVAYAEAQKELGLANSTSSFSASNTLAEIDPEQRAMLSAEGAQLFNRLRCVACHAANGGVKPLQSLGKKYDIATMAKFIERPNPPMPVYPLTDEQRTSLSVYLIETYSE